MFFFSQIPINDVPNAYVMQVNVSAPSTFAVPELQRGPTRQEIQQQCQKLTDLFKDGFQWQDLAQMVRLVDEFLDAFPSLGLTGRRDALIQILDEVIDSTDTPLLPDKFTDPLFKAMVPPFVTLMLTYRDLIFPPVSGKPSWRDVQKTVQSLRDAFVDGFQWQDLASVLQFAVRFAGQFRDLSSADKVALVNQLLDFVIDATDTPYLPDQFADPIFKAFIHPMISLIFNYNES